VRRFVSDRLNQWLTLVANVGVVDGFVFLGLEIQQNSDAINAQTYQSRAEAAQELSTTIMDSEHFVPLLAKLGSGLFPSDPAVLAELNPEDRIRLTAFHQWMRVALDNQFYQYQRGFLDEEFFNGVTKPSMAAMTPAWEELRVILSASPAFREAIAP
jgi:hypothetical protein